jgi:hypothetical protein
MTNYLYLRVGRHNTRGCHHQSLGELNQYIKEDVGYYTLAAQTYLNQVCYCACSFIQPFSSSSLVGCTRSQHPVNLRPLSISLLGVISVPSLDYSSTRLLYLSCLHC